MTTTPTFTQRLRAARTPAWSALVAAIITQIASAPGQTVGVSVFVDHLIDDLDLTRSTVSGAYLVGTLTGAISMPVAGRLIDRRGLRWATLAFSGGFGTVLMAMGGVTGLVTLTIGFGFTRMLGQGALSLTSTTTVAVWFEERRGWAMGLQGALGGGAMSLVPLASAAVVGGVGWRMAWVVLGCAVWAVMVPLGLFVVRNPPGFGPVPGASDHADPPDGSASGDPVIAPATADATTTDRTATDRTTTDRTAADPSMAEILRHPAFLVVVGAVSLSALVGTALIFHQVDVLGRQGLSEVEAAANFVPQTVATIAAALTMGRLADRLKPRWLLASSILGLALAPLAVGLVSGRLTAALYGILLGGSGGAIRTLEGVVLPRWFGLGRIGELRGVVMAAGVGGSAIGPAMLSVGADLTGGYGVTLWVFAAAALVLAAAAVLVQEPARPAGGGPGGT
ncbi:MAG: MFS transporter [Actinomycetota bacterium]|nr:MFS transporter [Actinomycetota bacterium]